MHSFVIFLCLFDDICEFSPRLWFEKHRFPGDPRKHVRNCGRFGASPGGRPYKFCGGRPGGPVWNDFGQIADHLRYDRERGCSSHAPARPRATPAPPRARARRPQGRRLPAGALLLRGVSCARPPSGASVRGPTHGRAGPQGACNMRVRVPASARACARSLLARNCVLLHAVRALARPHAQLLCMRVRRGPSRSVQNGPACPRVCCRAACVQGSCSVQGHVF